MKKSDSNTALLNNYFGLIKNLSPEFKLNLIEKINQTLKNNFSNSDEKLADSFGLWKSNESAEKIIQEIRDNRTFNRKTEDF